MELTLFLTLMAVAGLFSFLAAVSKDKVNLYPAAAVLLLTGWFLISGPGLKIPAGQSYDYKEVNTSIDSNSTVRVNMTQNYSTVEYPVAEVEFSHLLGFLLVGISLYFFLIPQDQFFFRSVMRRLKRRR